MEQDNHQAEPLMKRLDWEHAVESDYFWKVPAPDTDLLHWNYNVPIQAPELGFQISSFDFGSDKFQLRLRHRSGWPKMSRSEAAS